MVRPSCLRVIHFLRDKACLIVTCAPLVTPLPLLLLRPSAYTMSRRGGGNFGLSASRRSRGSFRGRGQSFTRGGRGRGHGGSNANAVVAIPTKDEEGTQLAERFEQIRTNDEVDEKLGFGRIQDGPRREGWLINMHPVCEVSWSACRMLIFLADSRSRS